MSSREAHSRSRSTAGGTIHPETTNAELLALLRENSSTPTSHLAPALRTSAPGPSAPTPSHPHPAQRPEPEPESPGNGTAKPSSGENHSQDPRTARHSGEASPPRTPATNSGQPRSVSDEPSQPVPLLPRSVSQTALGEEQEDGRGEKSGSPSQAASPISRTLASDSDSVSSELGRLLGTPSRKSFAISEGAFGDEADDEGEDDAETPVASPDLSDARADAGDGAGADQRHRGRDSAASPPLPAAAAAVPAGSRGGNPAAVPLHGAPIPSPDLTNPDHQRFVTPYASRRLKDKAAGRSSAVSAALAEEDEEPPERRAALNVPKDQSWSATQAARLRAGGGRAGEAAAPAAGNEAPDSPGTPTPRNSDSEGHLDLVDSLEVPTDRSPESEPPASNRAAPPSDQQRTGSNHPTPQPRASSNLSSSGPARAPEAAAFRADSLEPPQAPEARELRPDSLEPGRSPELAPSDAQPSDRRRDSYPRLADSAEPFLQVGTSPTAVDGTGPASQPNSARVTPASILKKPKEQDRLTAEPAPSRVYVDSPTFTTEEEEEYRFVSSRIDHADADEPDDDNHHATYRGLDELAVSRMEGGVAVGARGNRKPFKQVRYQDDEDRYEDRQELLGYAPHQPRREEPPQKQYVLKSKNGSAQAGGSQPPAPVRSLTLPTGPSYDPADEEELARETSYQQGLRSRVSTLRRNAEDTVVPRLPLHAAESEDYARDSLDIPEDLELDSSRLAQHRNSVDVYEQRQLYQAMSNDQWADPPGPPGGYGRGGGFPPQRQGYGNVVRPGYAQPQRGYADDPRERDYEDPYRQGGYGGHPPGAYDDPRRQGYGDPQRQGYGEPQRQGYGDPRQQGYGDPQRQGYGDPQRQGYGDPERQGYGEPQRQGYGDPRQQGYGDPQRQGYGDPQRQGYGDPHPQGYGDPQRQGYGEPHSQGYGDPQRQGYEDPQRQGYGDPQRQGYADPQRQGYADPQRQTYANPPAGYADVPRQGYDDQQYGQPPARGPDPRYVQQAPPPPPPPPAQGGQYADADPRYQGQHQGHYVERNGPPAQQGYGAEPQDGFYLTEPRGYDEGLPPSYRDDDYYQNYDDGDRTLYAENPADNAVPDSDRYEERSRSQKTTGRLSSETNHDYVSTNKTSYGRPEQRTYKKIHQVKKEEEEKLGQVFIQPKVKGKGSKGSRNSSPSRQPPPPIAENPAENVIDQGAQDLWAKRSASLARAKNSKQGGKKKSGSNTSLAAGNTHRIYPSDGSIPSTAQGPPAPARQPLQTANNSNNTQLVPFAQQPAQASPAHSPFRHAMDFKPISQQLITEDGQRISVDVNLRLISPPVGSEPLNGGGFGNQPVGSQQRLLGLQYPIEGGPGGQHQPYGSPDENEVPGGRYSADDILGAQGNNAMRGQGNTGYVSDSNHDYSDQVYSTNPYKKIPPIPSNPEAPRSAPVVSEGSYMMSYIREKEKVERGPKPWYKVYGLKDYKRMQNEVRLGSRTLGPDLDNDIFKERREKMMRQLDYAKGVKVKNTKDLARKPPAAPKVSNEDDMLSKRRLAVEYSKNVPKPTVKPRPNPNNSYELASKLSPIAKPNRGQPSPLHEPAPGVDVLDLQKLHERHQQDKQSAELIRQKAQGVMS